MGAKTKIDWCDSTWNPVTGCLHGCKYCYANFSEKTVIKNHGIHDPSSPLISGIITEEDVIREREMHSCKQCQLNLFE